VEIRPAEAKLFSLLSYRVGGVRVNARGTRVGVSVETVGGAPGRHVFHLEVIRPDGRAEPLYQRNLVGEGGAAEAEIPFAESDPRGVWTVRARDVATGMVGETRLRR
ncbi:MAG: hypothetical protein QHJ73_19690, partial [Armatimonadota bacterium]|nr:hypothetical protein [Armatimonadota bacterium]